MGGRLGESLWRERVFPLLEPTWEPQSWAGPSFYTNDTASFRLIGASDERTQELNILNTLLIRKTGLQKVFRVSGRSIKLWRHLEVIWTLEEARTVFGQWDRAPGSCGNHVHPFCIVVFPLSSTHQR